MAGQQISNGFVITIDGSPLAADIEQLLVEAYMDDNRNLPDMFVLRFRDANRLVLSKAAVKIGSRTLPRASRGRACGYQVEAEPHGRGAEHADHEAR